MTKKLLLSSKTEYVAEILNGTKKYEAAKKEVK